VLLLLDNYDSFTYILQDYFSQLQSSCTVIRNDDKTIDEIVGLQPSGIIFSPGPETPSKAGIMMQLISHYYDKIPLLGICLGHQAIGEFFGASLVKAKMPMHGRTSLIHHEHHPLFHNINTPFQAMRYHSLILENVEQTQLKVVAKTDSEEVMAMVHPHYKLCGIQFHPESILTPHGITMLYNWLKWSSLK
jgi:anthranilate synthase/aminodeoxychorismate synthase-like glutamine amidotransferase